MSMNAMLNAMAQDMSIPRYNGESEKDYCYRLCYSALGQWCLSLASSKTKGVVAVSSAKITSTLNGLFKSYAQLFPDLQSRFKEDFATFFRTVYEETGYLLNVEKVIRIANYGRSIKLGKKMLIFGFDNSDCEVNGLGIFVEQQEAFISSVKEFLRRDSLSVEEYFSQSFNPWNLTVSLFQVPNVLSWNSLI
jgi:hypothetical protein